MSLFSLIHNLIREDRVQDDSEQELGRLCPEKISLDDWQLS